ncbi:MAG: Rrf2 family transcriptional regulator [Phycisphaerae bacterium]|nr:Rrf2 family transcriptional regulator [Phycisphaerae bacterium]
MSFNLTRKTDYGLVALAVLAERAETAGPCLSARQIAEENDLPVSLLMKVLKDLHRAGIVASRRGAGGGYFLERGTDGISMLQVIEALEGPVVVARCCSEEEEEGDACVACRAVETCPITLPMQRFNERMSAFLDNIDLRELTQSRTSVTLTRSGNTA